MSPIPEGMTPDLLAEKMAAGEVTLDDLDMDPVAVIEWITEQRSAAYAAEQAAITPHVRPPAKRKVPRMSGPRYFNLMRAMDADPAAYADYRAGSTYCGAAITTRDYLASDLRWPKAREAAAEDGACPDCLAALPALSERKPR